jgi:hypothetical protein
MVMVYRRFTSLLVYWFTCSKIFTCFIKFTRSNFWYWDFAFENAPAKRVNR